MGRLQGKVAVITGGTTGIGLASAKLFVQEGAHVFITGRRQKELDEAVKTIGNSATGVQGDVAKLADLDRLYETVKKRGRIDIVFANAGYGEFASLGSVTEEHFDKLFNVNVKGALFTVQKALPLLNDGGSIILTGSVASVKGTPAFWVYGATKAAIRNFVRAWTVELKDRRIRSNVLSPGPTDTPQVTRQPADAIARIVSRWDAWGSPRKSPRQRCFWPRMTPVLSAAANYLLMAAERRSKGLSRCICLVGNLPVPSARLRAATARSGDASDRYTCSEGRPAVRPAASS
jgi:NAD(P)-dependent dehydrogenase (short-subunit alcohol dehydrogenase family)